MVYKKYIKRDGKLYGPYTYESKRVDGKVVSQYHGTAKTFNFKKIALIFVSSAFVLFLAYFLATFDFTGLTGQAVLNTEIEQATNEPIKGEMTISLREGELIPSDSKLILENSGQSYEYNLNDLVSNTVVSGDFFIDGQSLSGNGLGYGIEGERTIYPLVSFVLNIYSPTEVLNETLPVSNNSITNNTENGENPIVNSSSEVINDNGGTIVESPVEVAVVGGDTITPGNVNSEPIAPENSPITGFFVRLYNFFLALTPTGNAVSDTSTEVSGETSFEKPFEHNVLGGEAVQLKSGSVSTSGSEVLSDNIVQITAEGNVVFVETSYSETEKGFGQEFLGSGNEIISVNLSALGLILNDGELLIKIVHGNQEIVSSSVILESGVAETAVANISNQTVMNITIEQPINSTLSFVDILSQDNRTPQVITVNTVQFVLTDDEKALIAQEFNDNEVKMTKSEIFNGRLIIRHEIGNQWIEYSYDPNTPSEELEYQISLDRMKWLKDLAIRINNKKN